MWRIVGGRLIQTTDSTRVNFRTNISKAIVDKLNFIANENDTYVNYLLETGLQEVLAQDIITFDKKARPKDRVQFKTTYDKELLEEIKIFAKKNKLNFNDVIEYSVKYIDVESAKKRGHKFRIE
ncbi:rRNA methyltransferase [Bacillaceae bacterium S4-13-58]